MSTTQKQDALSAKTPEAILSYPFFAEPQTDDKGKKKYTGTLIMLPEAQKTPQFAGLIAAAVAAARAQFPGGIKLPNGTDITVEQAFAEGILRTPFRKDWLKKGYPEGSVFINVRSESQPGLVYPHAEPGTSKPAKVPADKIKDEFYPGSIVRASVRAFYYDNSGNKGISFALNNVQKLREGPRLDNRVAAEDDFESLAQTPVDLAQAGLV